MADPQPIVKSATLLPVYLSGRMVLLSIFLITAVLGAIVGLLAGLLGIGGGLIIVPVLVVLLPALSIVPPEHAMLVAIATSLASIVITSLSSVRAHHKRNNVPWAIAMPVMFGAALGAMLMGYLAHNLSGKTLQLLFGVAVGLLALRMLFTSNTQGKKPLPARAIVAAISGILGSFAALLGIGGGALIVPMLNYFSVDMRRAIGCASASGIAIAVFGSLGYVTAGWQQYQLSAGFVGYVYLPALLGVISTSVFTTSLGATLTQRLPVITIKRVFGVFLILVAVRMILS